MSASFSSAAAHIECSDQPFDLSFHPSHPTLLAAALVDGTIEIHDFAELLEHQTVTLRNNNIIDEDCSDDDEIDTIVSSTAVHTQLLPSKLTSDETKQAAARCCHFASDGQSLYSGGTAGDLVCLHTERISTFRGGHEHQNNNTSSAISWTIPDAAFGKSPLQVVQEVSVTVHPHLLLTGDDSGGLRIFDIRLCGNATKTSSTLPRACVHSWKHHQDTVSGVAVTEDGMTLLAASTDCTLSVYDLRMTPVSTSTGSQPLTDKDRFVRQSDDQEDELLSIQIIKNGRKVVCGTGQGVLAVWSFGVWGDISDRFPVLKNINGGKNSAGIDALLKLDEDTLLLGSADGSLRVVSVHPDHLVGVLGDDHGGFPIERMQFNCNRDFVATVTHDTTVRLWDATVLRDGDDRADQEPLQQRSSNTSSLESRLRRAPVVSTPLPSADRKEDSDDEWDDMDEDMEIDDDQDDDNNSDNSSSDDDSDQSDNKHRSKNEQRSRRLDKNASFFSDL